MMKESLDTEPCNMAILNGSAIQYCTGSMLCLANVSYSISHQDTSYIHVAQMIIVKVYYIHTSA